MIFRRLPRYIVPVYEALRTPHTQNNLAGSNTVLTPPTIGRLDNIFPLVQTDIQKINLRTSERSKAVVQKNAAQEKLNMLVRHFLLTVIMAAERNAINPSDLALYGLELTNPTLPVMKSEQDLMTAAENALTGEAARVGGGGTPITFPTAIEVKGAYDNLVAAMGVRNTKAIALDDAEEELEANMPEAKAVVKKVWDEAETFYNEEADESRRANCRLWGVVYISDTRIQVTAQALTVINGRAEALPAALLRLLQTDDEDAADTNGDLVMKTGYTGNGILEISCEGYVSQQFTRNFTGVDDINLGEVTMVAVV